MLSMYSQTITLARSLIEYNENIGNTTDEVVKFHNNFLMLARDIYDYITSIKMATY